MSYAEPGERWQKKFPRNLFREDELGRICFAVGEKLLPVIGNKYKKELLREVHDKQCHLGVYKCMMRIKNKVWWPGIKKDVTNYINACEWCQKAKIS
jgi:hypothetical protein